MSEFYSLPSFICTECMMALRCEIKNTGSVKSLVLIHDRHVKADGGLCPNSGRVYKAKTVELPELILAEVG